MNTPPAFEGVFRTDVRTCAAYAESAGIYRIVPAAVAVPASVEDLARLVQWARNERLGLVPRGAGSSIGGGAVGDGVVVDLRERMPRRLEIDAERRLATTSANIALGELNQQASRWGLRLPPDPSSGTWATLGGMVACNAAGARSVKCGSVRPWVEGLELVTDDGEVGWLWRTGDRGPGDHPTASPGLTALKRFHSDVAPRLLAAAALIGARFPKVRKNAAGFALDHWLESRDDLELLIGAEGTLGFITTITWRLERIPTARSALRIALGSLDDLEEAVRALAALGPSALELLDRTFLDLLTLAGGDVERPDVPPNTQAVLLVEFEGEDAAELRSRAADAVRALTALTLDARTALTPGEERRLWSLRHAASPILARLPPDRRSLQVIEDGCVPLAQLGAYVRAIRQAAEARQLTVVVFGHAGDGNVHVNVLPEVSRPDWQERIAGLYQEVHETVLGLGGTLTGEHGDGRLRASWLPRQFGHDVLELFWRVKTAFDPLGILNPGVKLAGSAPPFARLKVGPDAASIPDDIASALRQIERSGGYARSRLELADSDPGLGVPGVG